MHHTNPACDCCAALPQRGKAFSRADSHMWLQFQQLKVAASSDDTLHYLSFVNDSPFKGSSYLSQGQNLAEQYV